MKPLTRIMLPLFAACLGFGSAVLKAEEEKASPATPPIVRIRTYSSGDATPPPAGESLGFVVESNGMILTSYRPLTDPATEALRPRIEVEQIGKEPVPASIIAVEPTLNFAILKIDAGEPLTASAICPREDIVPGLKVHAPVGFEQGKPLFSDGEITDLNSMECYQESMTATMLRAKIRIPDASFGAPVFNDKGEVVALHTGYTKRDDEAAHEPVSPADEGKIHILPIFLVFNIYESVKLKQNMKSPWTGFSVRSATDQEKTVFPVGKFLGGVGIDYVWEGGPAEKMGVKKDDLLVGFSYYPTKTVAAFQKWLYMYGVGFKVKLHFLRNGKEYYAVDYTIEERPKWAKPR